MTLGIALFFLKVEDAYIQEIIQDERATYTLTGQIAFPNPSTYVAYIESEDKVWLRQLLKTPSAYGNTVCPVNKRQAIGFIKKGWNWYEHPAQALPPKKRKHEADSPYHPIPPPVRKRDQEAVQPTLDKWEKLESESEEEVELNETQQS